MKMHSAQNERIKRAYFIYLAEAQASQRVYARCCSEG